MDGIERGEQRMDGSWKDLKIVRDFFQIQEDGKMPEGSKLLLEAMEPVYFTDGQDIVTEGASPEDGMYIILEGQAHVLAGGVLVNELAEGDVVGELALIKEGVRKATVRAVGPVTCANISQSLFTEIADANRKVYAALLEPGACAVLDLPAAGGLGVVIGNEGSGVSPEAARAARKGVYIPMAPAIESLNAAAAATVIMWEMSGRGRN